MLASVLAAVLLGHTVGSGLQSDVLVTLDQLVVVDALYGAWRLNLPANATVEVTVAGNPTTANGMGFGIWMWPTADFSQRTRSVGWLAVGGQRIHAQVLGSGGPEFTFRNRIDCEHVYPLIEPVFPWECLLSYRLRKDVVGDDWTVVAMGGVDGAWEGGITLRATEGARIIARETGSAFYEREEDFTSTVNVFWNDSAVMLDAAVHHAVGGRLFGGFFGKNVGFWGQTFGGFQMLEMGYEGPGGSWSGDDTYILEDQPPGDYWFRVQRNVAVDSSYVNLIGADVRIPG